MDTPQTVISVEAGSPAALAGVEQGDGLLAINGEPVLDFIDYEYLSAGRLLTLTVRKPSGDVREYVLAKEEYASLGLGFSSGLMSRQRSCCNRCIFCFVDQLPKGVRPSLRVKDDDWRLSLMMGNYVSLTNLSDAELTRIIRRMAGPLYISVHAAEPELRGKMMGNASAGRILEQLDRLAQAGIGFHAQAVLCPGVNDGAELERTIRTLAALRPAALSLSVVPVGLTKHRAGLYPLHGFTRGEARAVLRQVHQWRGPEGGRFVYASDEFYLLAEQPLPAYEEYDDFPQIENGVGVLRLFEREFEDAMPSASKAKGRVTIATGVAAAPWLQRLAERAMRAAPGLTVDVCAAQNAFFGGNVTVAGLVTGSDLARQLAGKALGDALLLPESMLREGERFLDGMTPEELARELRVPVRPVEVSGGALVRALGIKERGGRQR